MSIVLYGRCTVGNGYWELPKKKVKLCSMETQFQWDRSPWIWKIFISLPQQILFDLTMTALCLASFPKLMEDKDDLNKGPFENIFKIILKVQLHINSIFWANVSFGVYVQLKPHPQQYKYLIKWSFCKQTCQQCRIARSKSFFEVWMRFLFRVNSL